MGVGVDDIRCSPRGGPRVLQAPCKAKGVFKRLKIVILSVADRIANLGANVYVLNRFGIITSEDAWVKAQKRPLVTREEFDKLQTGMRTANQIAALLGTNTEVRYGNDLLENVSFYGVTS